MWFLRLIPAVVVAVFLAIFTPTARSGPVLEIRSVFTFGPATPSSGAVVLGPDGYYWGTSAQGGEKSQGTVFKVRPDGSDMRVVHSFDVGPGGHAPGGGLAYDGAGNMWGTTVAGGIDVSGGEGTIFKIKVSDGTLTTLVKFSDPSPKGAFPRGTLLKAGSFMWGTATNGGASNRGTVFKVSSAGKLTTVVEFTGNGPTNKGASPQSELMFDGELFWGTTTAGGANDKGTIFSIDAAGKLTTVVEFSGNGTENKGATPFGTLAVADANTLWGTTSAGGASGFGTIFKLDKTTKVLTTLVEFTGTVAPSKGNAPRATLVSDGAGAFWGTTNLGGAPNAGTVFKIDTATGTLTTKAELTGVGLGKTGGNPGAPLLSDGAGNFVGTFYYGGGDNRGRIFKINQTTGAVTPVADFLGLARNPYGSLTSDLAGNLWGATAATVNFNNGTIFRYNPATGERTTIIDLVTTVERFRGASKLYFDGVNTFWGTCSDASGSTGGIFKINATTGVFTTVLTFTGTGAVKGTNPIEGLVSDGLGFLWGCTSGGGDNGYGTIFKIDPTSTDPTTHGLTTLLSLTANDVHNSGLAQPLLNDGGNFMWGTMGVDFSGSSGGTIFKISKVSPYTLTTVKQFAYAPFGTTETGAFPRIGYQDGAGSLWGAGARAVIKINIATNAITYFPTTISHAPSGDFVSDGAGFLWDVGAGGIVKFDLVTNIARKVLGFPASNPGPQAPLYLDPSGAFYGVCSNAIFRLNQTGGPDPIPVPNFETVARVGDKLSGLGFDGYFGPLGAPQTGAFGGMLQFYQGAPPHQMKVFSPAIFAPDGTLRVRVNDAVPSINNRAGIKTLGEPCGDAVKATLYDNETITKNDDELLLGGLTTGPWKVAARENQPITGQTGDVRLKKIITFDGNGLDYFFLAQLQGSNVSAKTDMALCVASGDGTVRALVREGDMLGGKSVTTIATLVAMKASLAEDRWRASANGFGVRLTFDDKTQAYFTVPSSATLPTDWKQWLVTESAFDTAKVATLGFPAFGDLGPAAVITLKNGTQPVDKKHDVRVVRVDNTDATVLATEGNSAPDANGMPIPNATFKTFSEPVAGKSGRAAFMATLAGVTPTAGIWYSADGDHLKLLARVGDAAPGGGVWSAFTQLVLPGGATSGPHFLGTLKTDATAGISKANNTGIWSVKSNGVLDLTLRNGTSLDVPDPRTLKSFVALATAPDSLGAARGYDDAGQIAVLATFTDNSVALLRLAVP